MILIHLLYPEQFAKDNDFTKVDWNKYDQLMLRKHDGRGKLLKYKDVWRDVNRLIEGLTLCDLNNRWGAYEVGQWMNGQGDRIEVVTDSVLTEIRLDRETVIFTSEIWFVI